MYTSQIHLPNPNQSAKAVNSNDAWEAHRAEITELYAVKTLQEVRDEMKSRHGFTATIKQWKNHLSRWKLDKKYIKPAEYRAMLRKKREREEEEPQKASQFILDGVEVPSEKLARYEKRVAKNKGLNEQQGDAPTPPGLICRTPPIPYSNSSLRPSRVDSPSTSFDPSLSAYRDLFPVQLSPIAFTTPMITMQSNSIARSPSIENFDWFNEYIEYNNSINNTPQLPESELIKLLLNFQEALHNYEEERAYKSFVEDLNLSCSDHYDIALVIFNLEYFLGDPGDEKTAQMIKRWARATVQKTFQLGLEGKDLVEAVVSIAEATGVLLLFLGEPQVAKPFLEYSIVEMSRFGILRKDARRATTLWLAVCNWRLGNTPKVLELLQPLFKGLYPTLVALSYEDLDSQFHHLCKYHQACFDDTELDFRLKAVRMIGEFLPGTVHEVKKGYIEEAMCHCKGDDRCEEVEE